MNIEGYEKIEKTGGRKKEEKAGCVREIDEGLEGGSD